MSTKIIGGITCTEVNTKYNECRYCAKFTDFRYRKFCSTKCEWKYEEKSEIRKNKNHPEIVSPLELYSVKLNALEQKIKALENVLLRNNMEDRFEKQIDNIEEKVNFLYHAS